MGVGPEPRYALTTRGRGDPTCEARDTNVTWGVGFPNLEYLTSALQREDIYLERLVLEERCLSLH